MNEKLVEDLVAAGFSTYEAKAIVAMIGKEPMGLSEIAETAGIPSSKIKDTISRLVSKGIVSVIPTGKRKKYRIISATATILPILKETRKRIENAEVEIKALDRGRKKESIQIAYGRDAVLRLAESAVRSAEHEVWASARDFSTPEWFVNAVKDGIARGVKFYLMGKVDANNIRRARTYQRLGVNVKKTADELPVMIVVDDKAVFIKTGNWSEAIAIYSTPIARFLKRYLERIWDHSIPV